MCVMRLATAQAMKERVNSPSRELSPHTAIDKSVAQGAAPMVRRLPATCNMGPSVRQMPCMFVLGPPAAPKLELLLKLATSRIKTRVYCDFTRRLASTKLATTSECIWHDLTREGSALYWQCQSIYICSSICGCGGGPEGRDLHDGYTLTRNLIFKSAVWRARNCR